MLIPAHLRHQPQVQTDVLRHDRLCHSLRGRRSLRRHLPMQARASRLGQDNTWGAMLQPRALRHRDQRAQHRRRRRYHRAPDPSGVEIAGLTHAESGPCCHIPPCSIVRSSRFQCTPFFTSIDSRY